MLLTDLPNTAKPPPYASHMSLVEKSRRKVLGETVKQLREKRGWNQTQLGTKSGTSQRTVSNVENGTNDPSTDVIEGIAQAFGLPSYMLLIPGVPPDLRDSPEIPTIIERYIAFAKGRG